MNLYLSEGRVKRRAILLEGIAVAAAAVLGVMLWNRIPTCHLSGPSQSPAQRISGYGMSGIVAPDGTLWVWGEDTWGVIRTNGGFHSRPRKLGPIEDWRQVASSGGAYVGLRRDCSVWGWRGPRTLHGQVLLPIGAPEPLAPGTNWVQVVGGMHRFFLLRADGSLFAAGDNSDGQLGDGTTVDRDHFVPVASERRWRQLAVTPDVTTAIDCEGGLWQWGRLIGPKPAARGIPNRFPFDNTPWPRLPVPLEIRPLWMENSGERFYGWSDDGRLWVRGRAHNDGSGILNTHRWKRAVAEWLRRHQIDFATLSRWSAKDAKDGHYNTNFVAVARFVFP